MKYERRAANEDHGQTVNKL